SAFADRHTWQSRSVADQHRRLVFQQLEHPDEVPPFRGFVELMRVLVGEFELPETPRLLDLGCGAGHYSELLERNFPSRFRYTGWDSSAEMVAAARAQWPEREFVVADVFDDTLPTVDVLLAR